MVNIDDNPLYDYMIDYNFSREQHNIFVDILSAFSLQLRRQSEQLEKMELNILNLIKKPCYLNTLI